MARRVNYAKKVEKIKCQLDTLLNDLENCSKQKEEAVVAEPKIKISDIDFEQEDLANLMKIQTRLVRVINSRMRL